MRIAIATDETLVSAHFGRCETYTIVDIEDNKELSRNIIQNPEHEPGFLPGFLASKGVQCVICGGMGPRAQNLFTQHNIKSIIGVSGTIDEVVVNFLKDTLESGASTCDQAEGHGHGHGHGNCGNHR